MHGAVRKLWWMVKQNTRESISWYVTQRFHLPLIHPSIHPSPFPTFVSCVLIILFCLLPQIPSSHPSWFTFFCQLSALVERNSIHVYVSVCVCVGVVSPCSGVVLYQASASRRPEAAEPTSAHYQLAAMFSGISFSFWHQFFRSVTSLPMPYSL